MEKKSVELSVQMWEQVVGFMGVEYETTRDNLFTNFGPVDENRRKLIRLREDIIHIQNRVGQVWWEFIVVGLYDTERKITIDNRDIDWTDIKVEGYEYPLELSREILQGYLDTIPHDVLSDEGVEFHQSLITLVLYLEDIKYLLENMDENNPEFE